MGERVLAPGGWQTHAVLPAKALGRRLDLAGLPLSTALGGCMACRASPPIPAFMKSPACSRERRWWWPPQRPVGATVAQLGCRRARA